MTTKIEWCDETWNPITGCSHAGSPGCDHCYAKRMANRLRGRFGYPQDDPFKPGIVHPKKMHWPYTWKKPRKIFVNSMGDLFHSSVSAEDIHKIIEIADDNPQHTFMIPTKRPGKMHHYFEAYGFQGHGENIWLGVTVENQEQAEKRIPILLEIPAAVRFVSVEPMLSEIKLDKYTGTYFCSCCEYRGFEVGEDDEIDGEYCCPKCKSDSWYFHDVETHGAGIETLLNWVICGGETGPGARPMQLEWAQSLQGQCSRSQTPFFFKGWGSREPLTPGCTRLSTAELEKNNGRLLDGKEYNQFPKGE